MRFESTNIAFFMIDDVIGVPSVMYIGCVCVWGGGGGGGSWNEIIYPFQKSNGCTSSHTL